MGGVGLAAVVGGGTALEFFRGLPRSFWSSTDSPDASARAAADGTSLPTGSLDPSAKNARCGNQSQFVSFVFLLFLDPYTSSHVSGNSDILY